MIWLILRPIGSNHKLRQIGLNFTLGRFEQYRLPKSKAERERLRLKIGTDGHHLLEALYKYSTSKGLPINKISNRRFPLAGESASSPWF